MKKFERQIVKGLLGIFIIMLILRFLEVSANLELYDDYGIHSNPAANLQMLGIFLLFLGIGLSLFLLWHDRKKSRP